jgi:hypothetical protein
MPVLPEKVCYITSDPLTHSEPRHAFLEGERTNTMHANRSAADWFHEAECAYCEQHQGCAWCSNTHCVRQSHHRGKHIFACQRCDFQVSYEAKANRYHVVPGEELNESAETMLEHPIPDFLREMREVS